jgi:hypothetical protein
MPKGAAIQGSLRAEWRKLVKGLTGHRCTDRCQKCIEAYQASLSRGIPHIPFAMLPEKNTYELDPEDAWGEEVWDDEESHDPITPATRCTAAEWATPPLWGQCPRRRKSGFDLCARCLEDLGEWEEHRKADEPPNRAWAMTVRMPVPRLIDYAADGSEARKGWVRGLIDRHPGSRQVWAAFRRFAATDITFEVAPEVDISSPAKLRRAIRMACRREKSIADSVSERCGVRTRLAIQHVLGLKDDELALWFMAFCTHELVKGKIVEADW